MRTDHQRPFALFLVLWAAAVGVGSGSIAAPTSSGRITDCASFRDWLVGQPASSSTIMSATPEKYPAPAHPDLLQISFAGATAYRTNVGSGRCLAGWYDPATRRAAVEDQFDTYTATSLFDVSGAPKGLKARPLGALRTKRGVALGMTIDQVRRIDGPGGPARAGTQTILRYHWVTQPYDTLNDLTFVFAKSRLIAMGYGQGQ